MSPARECENLSLAPSTKKLREDVAIFRTVFHSSTSPPIVADTSSGSTGHPLCYPACWAKASSDVHERLVVATTAVNGSKTASSRFFAGPPGTGRLVRGSGASQASKPIRVPQGTVYDEKTWRALQIVLDTQGCFRCREIGLVS